MAKNLITGNTGSKRSGKFSKYANPTFITKNENLMTGVVKSDFGKTAYYDTEQTIPNFYTPELTPETWLLPRTRAEILRWCRLFFNLDPYINSILTMHAQYPISNFRLSYKDKDTEAFFNRKLFDNKEFSWIDFLEQVMLSYFKMGEAVVWADWSESKGTWNGFSLIDPSLIEYKEDPLSGEVEMSIIPTRELKQMLADGLKQGRTDIPVEYIRCVQENQKIPLDATGTEPNYLTGKKYSPAKVFMLARKTDPGATRGTPITQCLFKCLTGDTHVALLDGTNPTLKELVESGKKDFLVYGVDKEGNIVSAKAECAAYIKDEETLEVTLDNGSKIRCTKDHPFFLRCMTKVEAQNLKQGDLLKSLKGGSIKVVSVVPTGKVEPVYCVANAGENHNFMVSLEDGNGILSGNTLIYQDKIKLAQIACASGDTKVMLLNGTVWTMKELYITKSKDFCVCSCTENGEITSKKASKVICNGKKQLYRINLDNGYYLRFTEDHPFLMRDGSWKEVKDLKPGDSLMPFKGLNSLKVVSVEKDSIEDVYDIESVEDTHTFGVVTEDGSGVYVHNCADRLHLPIEIWTIGSYTGDPQTSIIPDDSMIGEVREAIRQATMQPPFSIFVPPYIKYEAVGVNGKLLSVYEDLGYVENCIFVGLGVNKNLILGAGPSFSSSKQTSLFKLIKMYKMLRLKLEAFIKRYILLPIARANDIKDEYGDYVVPNIEWEESLQPEQDVEKFNNVLKLWDKGLVSTTTVYEYFPGKLDINLEKQRLEMERGSIWDKGTDRLGSKAQRSDLNEKKPDTGNKSSMPTPSDGSKPAEGLPPPMGGDVEEGGEPESTEVPEAPEEVPAEQ